jgi:hypothetical protein
MNSQNGSQAEGVAESGFRGGYGTIKRFVRKLLRTSAARSARRNRHRPPERRLRLARIGRFRPMADFDNQGFGVG